MAPPLRHHAAFFVARFFRVVALRLAAERGELGPPAFFLFAAEDFAWRESASLEAALRGSF